MREVSLLAVDERTGQVRSCIHTSTYILELHYRSFLCSRTPLENLAQISLSRPPTPVIPYLCTWPLH